MTDFIDLSPQLMGGGGGGLTSAQVMQIAEMAAAVAQIGQTVIAGGVVFSSDSRIRFVNETLAPITLSGTMEDDLISDGLSPSSVEFDDNFYDREVNASGPLVAGESVLVLSSGLTLDFPVSGAQNDEIMIGNYSDGSVTLTGAFDGDTNATLVSVGIIVFRWNVSANEWRAYPVNSNLQSSGLTASQLGVV